MKRILPAGEGYGLFFTPPDGFKLHKILYIIIASIAFLFFFSSIAKAQIARANKAHNEFRKEHFPTKYYQVGDKLPKNFVLGYNPFDSTEVYTLADYKGKAVIIDVWATWCGSCISAFPKVDSLHKIYKTKIEVLLVNSQKPTPKSFGDDPEKVRNFITNYKSRNSSFSTQFLIEKQRIKDLFFFTGIPHYIWIDQNRRIRAITSAEEIKGENFEKLLYGQPMDLPIKKR